MKRGRPIERPRALCAALRAAVLAGETLQAAYRRLGVSDETVRRLARRDEEFRLVLELRHAIRHRRGADGRSEHQRKVSAGRRRGRRAPKEWRA